MSTKPHRVFFIIPILIFVLAFSTITVAQDVPVVNTGGATLVASVNIQGPTIVSQENNAFSLSFNLTNREGVQSGLYYRVQLMAITEKGEVVTDEKVYDEAVFLPEQSSVKKDITYTAPSSLSGTYKLYLDVQNEKGFPFAIASFGEVILVGNTTGVVIAPEKCSVKIGYQEFKSAPFQGILVNKDEAIAVSCTVTNTGAEAASITPSFETYSKTTIGEKIEGLVGDTTAVILAAGESKTLTFSSVVPNKPQLYKTIFSVSANGVRSNSIEIGYAVKGTMGTIENLSLDKEVFIKGETATLSVIWSAYTDNINKQSTDVTLTAEIKNANGRACAEPVSQTLPMARTTPTTDFSLVIDRDCKSPTVSVTLTDNEGVVLDTQSVQFESAETAAANTMKRNTIIIGVIILILLGLGLYIRRISKHTDTTPQEPVI